MTKDNDNPIAPWWVPSANQVTVARVCALPFCTALILSGNRTFFFIAFVLGVLTGATDFVDGYLARKYGSDDFGAFLDPLADKLFLVAIFVPFAAFSLSPGWLVGLLLVREMLVTGIRSEAAIAQAPLATSRLGKLKTIIQMGGMGALYLMQLWSYDASLAFNLIAPLVMLVVSVVLSLTRKKPMPFWLPGTLFIWLCAPVVQLAYGISAASTMTMAMIVGLTWVSGAAYIQSAWDSSSAIPRKTIVLRVLVALAFALAPTMVRDGDIALAAAVTLFIGAAFSSLGVENIFASRAQGFPGGFSFRLVGGATVFLFACAWILRMNHASKNLENTILVVPLLMLSMFLFAITIRAYKTLSDTALEPNADVSSPS